jgi:hypothetical protein
MTYRCLLTLAGVGLLTGLLLTPVAGQVPTALVGVFSGASQTSAWFSGSDVKDVGFTGSESDKLGREVWQEELHRFLPDLSISVGSRIKANVGFISHWWTEADGLSASGQAVRDELLHRMRSHPDAHGFVCHGLASAAYNESTPLRLRTELAGYAQALKQAVDEEFGTDRRRFTFWWLDAGNRWNNAEGGPNAAAARRRVPRDLAGTRDHMPEAAPLPYFRVSSTTMAYVIGDWNVSGDGTHLTRASNQRAGRQLAYDMLMDWGVAATAFRRPLAIDSAWRDPSADNAFIVKVLTNGGTLLVSRRPCSVSTAAGRGVSTDNHGLLNSDWTVTIERNVTSEGYALVRVARSSPLPEEDLFFSHTWGIWHTITPGRASNSYTGPLAVWHEDLSREGGMTQDFADLTAVPRAIILTLGSEQLIPIAAAAPDVLGRTSSAGD